ncbi:T-cell leukemia/lymphoma protein 1B [Choloepus didactylus]|uniref:T-cell leukemia/lymphoma protein 1B n=1 Tax=Choloepus didactylus TaxID=27675 RepID=UPI00189FA755|nr:T-cell leukemia/lymphoma protein 1B [Choloepus didactylus]
MASAASRGLGEPPDRLWVRRPGIYEDEVGRTWVTVVVRLGPSLRALGRGSPGSTHEPRVTVHMWQIAVHPQEPMSPSQLPLSQLPLMWQLYPGRRYRATDSRLWEIVDHGQVYTTEQLILSQQPVGND